LTDGCPGPGCRKPQYFRRFGSVERSAPRGDPFAGRYAPGEAFEAALLGPCLNPGPQPIDGLAVVVVRIEPALRVADPDLVRAEGAAEGP
jgi:hypothetical protein